MQKNHRLESLRHIRIDDLPAVSECLPVILNFNRIAK
jgi:hypothetical protein